MPTVSKQPPRTGETPSAAELLTLLDPVSEIYLDVAMDIRRLTAKILHLRDRLIEEKMEEPLEGEEMTEPMDDLYHAFDKAWATLGVRLCTRNTLTPNRSKP